MEQSEQAKNTSFVPEEAEKTEPSETETGGGEGELKVSQPEKQQDQKQIFSPAIWILLALAAGTIDLLQIFLTAISIMTFGLGTILSIILDFIFSMTLFSIFFFGGIRNKVVLGSVLAGLGIGVFSAGAMPAWIVDIGFAWILTDGRGSFGQIPLVGNLGNKLISTASQVSSGKIPLKK